MNTLKLRLPMFLVFESADLVMCFKTGMLLQELLEVDQRSDIYC